MARCARCFRPILNLAKRLVYRNCGLRATSFESGFSSRHFFSLTLALVRLCAARRAAARMGGPVSRIRAPRDENRLLRSPADCANGLQPVLDRERGRPRPSARFTLARWRNSGRRRAPARSDGARPSVARGGRRRRAVARSDLGELLGASRPFARRVSTLPLRAIR